MPPWPEVTAAGLGIGVLFGGVPATVVGALLSGSVGGKALLAASGIVLASVGIRILLPITSETRLAGRARRRAPLVVTAAAGIGFFTGLPPSS